MICTRMALVNMLLHSVLICTVACLSYEKYSRHITYNIIDDFKKVSLPYSVTSQCQNSSQENKAEKYRSFIFYRVTTHQSISLIQLLTGCEGDNIKIDLNQLNTTLIQHFSNTRHHATAPESKSSTRDYIAEYFRNLSLTVELDNFKSDDGKVTGTNIIGIYPGMNYDKGTDMMYMIGAYYDTKPITAGMYVNGAGVLAMLETSKLLVQSGEKENTLLFVAFDLHFNLEDDGIKDNGWCCQGAIHFVNTWLQEYLKRRYSTEQRVQFAGAFIMESILNYQVSTFTQEPNIAGPLGTQVIKDPLKTVLEKGIGDFMLMLSRPSDSNLRQRFSDMWKYVNSTSERYDLYHIEINLAFTNDAFYEELEKSVVKTDLSAFYRMKYNAVLVSDTGKYRLHSLNENAIFSCHEEHCNEISLVTYKQLHFLSKTIKTLVFTLETLSYGNASDVILTQIPHVKSTTPMDTTTTPMTLLDCPRSLYSYHIEFDLYFKFDTDGADERIWSDAKAACQAEGAQLLIISDNAMLNYFSNKLYKHYWVGMNDIEEEGIWKWLDGSNVTDDLWDTCQPDDFSFGEDCGIIRAKGKLYDLNCETNYLPYICACNDESAYKEMEKEECFVDGYQQIPELNIFYRVYHNDSEYNTWEEATKVCHSEHSELYNIAGMHEYSILFDIGKDLVKNEYFISISAKMTYLFKEWGHLPSDTDNTGFCIAVHMNRGLTELHYTNCSLELPFICSRFCQDMNLKQDDWTNEKIEVIFTTDRSIRIGLLTNGVEMIITSEVVTEERIYSLDYMYQREAMTLFWHMRSSTYIIMASLNESVIFLNKTVKTNDPLSDLSLDWLSGKIYWSCMEIETISFMDINTYRTKVLFMEQLYRPSNLKVDPVNGLMVWLESSGVKAASMDGDRTTITIILSGSFSHLSLGRYKLEESVQVAYGNYLKAMQDYEHRVSDIGDIRQEMVWQRMTCTDVQRPIHDIDVSGLFLVLKSGNLLLGFKRFPLKLHNVININEPFYEIKVVDNTRLFTGYDPCTSDSEKCSHFCTPSFLKSFSCICSLDGDYLVAVNDSCEHEKCSIDNGGCKQVCNSIQSYPYRRCGCFEGYMLLFDGKTCIRENETMHMMFYTDNLRIIQFMPQIAYGDWRQIQIEGFETYTGGGIDFDPIDFQIYWIQKKSYTIKRAFVNGTGVNEMFSSATELRSITLEVVRREIFVAVTSNYSIERITMKGDSQDIFHLLPRNCFANTMDIDGLNGDVYYSQQCEDNAYKDIYRIQMDTKKVTIIVQQIVGSTNIHAFDVDHVSGIIYWADGYINSQIEHRAVLGTESGIIVPNTQRLQYSDIHIVADQLYLIVPKTAIGWISLVSHVGEVYFLDYDISSIKGTSFITKTDMDGGYNCSEIAKCLGLNLQWICLSKSDVCDGIINCYSSYDEMHCPFKNYVTNQFQLSCNVLRDKHAYIYDNFTTDFVNWNTHPFFSFINATGFQNVHCDVDYGISHLTGIGIRKFSVSSLHVYERFRQVIASNILRNQMTIQSIRLSGDRISDSWTPYEFNAYSLLSSLTLSLVYMPVLIKDIFQTLSKLINLKLIIPSLKSMEAGALNGIYNCQNLTLSETQVSSFPLFVFDNLTSLTYLDLSYNKLTLLVDDLFKRLYSLAHLDLRGNDIFFASMIFSNNHQLIKIYSDTYAICCIRPSNMTVENCFAPNFDVSSCKDMVEIVVLRICMWIIGCIALIGNFVVFIKRFRSEKGLSQDTFSILVCNLTIADGLMGFYLIMIATVDEYYRDVYVWNEYRWRRSHLCSALGIISIISTELSVITISLITIARFLSVKYLFKEHEMSRRDAVIAIMLSWVISILMAVCPYFAFENFYAYSGVCVSLPLTKGTSAGWLYSFALFIVLNFLMFVFIAIAQVVIIYNVKKISSKIRSTGKDKYIEVAKRLTPIIVTDCLCWIPIGTMGVLAMSGYDMPRSVYAWTIVFVLPINSALNPILYTFDDQLVKFFSALNRAYLKLKDTLVDILSKIYISDRAFTIGIVLTLITTFIALMTNLILNGEKMKDYDKHYQHKVQILDHMKSLQNMTLKLEEKISINEIDGHIFGLKNSDDRLVCLDILDLEKPCFAIITQMLSWYEAEVYCQRFPYSYFYSTISVDVNDLLDLYMEPYTKSGFWIGLKQYIDFVKILNPIMRHFKNYELIKTYCLSINGSAVSEFGERVLQAQEEKNCYQQKPFICEIRFAGVNDMFEPCTYSWVASGEMCYIAIDKKSNWTDAEKHCNSLDGTLMTTETEDVQKLIKSALNGIQDTPEDGFFMGLKFHDNAWQWINTGENVNYTNWLIQHTADQTKNETCQYCGLWMPGQGSKWAYTCCSNEYSSICEKRKVT